MESLLTFDLEADELEIFLQDVNEQLRALAGILHLEKEVGLDTLNAALQAQRREGGR